MPKKRKKKLKWKNVIILILIFTVIIFLFSILNNDEEVVNLQENNKLSLIMTGDVLIHSSVYDDAYENGKYNFYKMVEFIKPIVNQYDLAFYNQESILGGTSLGLSSYPAFNSPFEVGEAFTNIGFNLVSLANNHTLDRGKSAVIASNNYWDSKINVVTSGSSNNSKSSKPKIYEKNGITYSLLAYTTTTNGIIPPNDYYVNVYSKQKVMDDINAIKDKADLILVSMHWGEEYNHNPTNEQKNIAKYLSSLGVDIVIGHHSHVVGPIDYIGDTLVIYSLGNFLSGQEGIDKQVGLMVSLDIYKDNDILVINRPNAMLTYAYYKEGSTKYDFKIYPFSKLNNDILPGYKDYYNKYMEIVTSYSDKVITSPI